MPVLSFTRKLIDGQYDLNNRSFTYPISVKEDALGRPGFGVDGFGLGLFGGLDGFPGKNQVLLSDVLLYYYPDWIFSISMENTFLRIVSGANQPTITEIEEMIELVRNYPDQASLSGLADFISDKITQKID